MCDDACDKSSYVKRPCVVTGQVEVKRSDANATQLVMATEPMSCERDAINYLKRSFFIGRVLACRVRKADCVIAFSFLLHRDERSFAYFIAGIVTVVVFFVLPVAMLVVRLGTVRNTHECGWGEKMMDGGFLLMRTVYQVESRSGKSLTRDFAGNDLRKASLRNLGMENIFTILRASTSTFLLTTTSFMASQRPSGVHCFPILMMM